MTLAHLGTTTAKKTTILAERMVVISLKRVLQAVATILV
ncbi:hypothetical protein Nizo2494_2323 [Lactiplantibacillus plantarum]|uniref:Uncharacterized protein n=2 Tax=Lactiplantibacillus plantarum TaxID=1590 RepID=A0AAP1EGD9_LACPN|nr:hypothetical protein LPST_C2395 [Lactiplantibacillus plantarum ST-III]AGL65126.2 hypothetical protein LBP_cg2380 [Lactiplantibacillus plantarum subsp. plantarum P-8]ERO41002.1 hypothetical protein LPLWJ_18990 [Lactiplantibacillus plantarum WJL]KFL87820.1 hypothetical protein LpDm1_1862 [Lactiplantibacillus plantarum]KPN42681.1 hypothetical protein WJL_1716 [Lactiplantibacillus plantarum WJL]